EALDPANVNHPSVEEILAARHCCSSELLASAAQVGPSAEDREHVGIEGPPGRVGAENVIDANVKTLAREECRTPLGRSVVQPARFFILHRRSEERHFEVNDLASLLRGEVKLRLRMTSGCRVRLIQQIEVYRLRRESFPPVPHYCGKELQIG